MTHLTITQGSTAETVSTALIKKLYDIAISIPEPLQGETDNAQISGHISVGTSYRSLVAYLAGTIMYKGTGEQGNNPQGRFLNLLIDVTNTYYMEFVDSAVESVLINAGLGDGTGITENDAAAATFGSPTVTFRDNTSITSFDEFGKFTYVNLRGKQNLFFGCTNLTSIDLTLLTTTAENEFRGIGITILNAPLLSNFTGANVFNGCTNLTTILSWGSITSIASLAFKGCTSLSTIPSLDNITELRGSCFEGCTSLSINNLELPNVTTLGSGNFLSVNLTGTLSIPKLASMGTSNFKNTRITLVKCLGHATEISGFENCTQLTTVHIPLDCTTIGISAFEGCTNLSTLDQFDLSFISLNYVNDGQYTYSSPSRITTIKTRAFLNCSSLMSFPFDNVTTILEGAFNNSGISGTINLQSLTYLGLSGFASTNISGVQNLENIINISKLGFYNCSSLSSISSNSVTSISDNAFDGCANLTSVSFPYCTSFGNNCFLQTNITSANINFENISNLGEAGIAWLNITIPVLNLPKITEGKKRLLGKLNAKLIYLPKIVNINNQLWFANDSSFSTFLTGSAITNGVPKSIGLMYFRDIANMSACMFALGAIKYIVINNSTTPTLQYNINGYTQALNRIFSKSSFDSTSSLYSSDAKIFVPDSAVTAYKTLFNDLLYFDVNCIHGINELDGNNNYLLPRVATRALWDLLSSSEQEITLIEEYM